MEISAKLSPRSVFLAGETVECAIKFRLTDLSRELCLAWSSVQMQCECETDDDKDNNENKQDKAKPKVRNVSSGLRAIRVVVLCIAGFENRF